MATVHLEGLICDSTARATPLAAVKLASESVFEFTTGEPERAEQLQSRPATLFCLASIQLLYNSLYSCWIAATSLRFHRTVAMICCLPAAAAAAAAAG